MKSKFLKLSLPRYLSLILVVFLFSCEKEDDQEVSVQENDSALKSFHTSVYQLESNAKFSNALKGILGKSSLQGRGNGEGSFGIEVDSSYVKVINGNRFDTYTMQIKSESQSNLSFSNLVVKLYQDSENVEAYVFDYLSDEPMSYYEPHQSYTFSGTTLVSYVNTSYPNQTLSQDCFITSITVCWHARVGNDTGPLHIAGSKCQTSEHMMTFATENCIGLPEYNPGNEPPNDYVNPCLREDCGGGGSIPQEEIDIPTEPVLVTAHNYFRNPSQKLNDLWIFVLDNTIKNEIINFLKNNKEPGQVYATPEAQAFAEEMMNLKVEHPSFNVDISRSFKSPFNIDLDDVKPNPNNPEPEKQRFMDIYDDLKETSLFKDIFEATFGENPNLNVKFEIVNDLPSKQDPTKQANGHTDLVSGTYNSTTNNINTVNIVIRINKKSLVGVNKQSNITVARTILHESIHAFLTLKKLDSDAGATLPNINNKDLSMLINDTYNNFNSPNSDQHSFMFDYLVPTIKNNLAAVKNEMIPQNEQNDAELYDFGGTHNGINIPSSPFNWNDFFYYYSMEGLHHTQVFDNEIKSDVIKNYVYGRYILMGRNFSKN